MYKLDVLQGEPKGVIQTKYGAFIRAFPTVRFDLVNMHIGKASFLRYYPFSIDGKSFIMRMYLTAKGEPEPPVKVLYEGALYDGKVTFQVLPWLNEILKDCDIKPNSIRLQSEVNSSP
jgi:hypothetical protein